MQEYFQAKEQGYSQANDELKKQKDLLHKIYTQKKEYKGFKNHVLILNEPYKVACSSVISLWFGFKGEIINSQDLNPKKQYVLYVNVFPHKHKTYILLSTPKNDKKKFKHFFNYLKSLNEDNLKKAISVLLLCYCQNIVINDSILDDKKLVNKINKITKETQIGPHFKDLEDPNYLKNLISKNINIFLM